MITKEEFESLKSGDEIILKSAAECERIMTKDEDNWNIDMSQYCDGRIIHFHEFGTIRGHNIFRITEDWYFFFWETIESILKYSPKPDKESIIIPTTSLF